MADGPSGVSGVWSRIASAYDTATSYSRAAITLGAATLAMVGQDAAQVPEPTKDEVERANRPRAQWQVPDGNGPSAPPPVGSPTGVRVGGGSAAVMRVAGALNPAIAGAEAASRIFTRPIAAGIVRIGNAVANVAHDANAAATTARAGGGRQVGGRGGPPGDESVPTSVPDPLLKRNVDMNAAIQACRKEIAGLDQAGRERIGMRTAADIENHFNGNVGAIHSRYAEIAGNPEKAASLERLTKMASQRDTYYPPGYRVQARILDNGEVALKFVRGSTERPAATFPWRAPT